MKLNEINIQVPTYILNVMIKFLDKINKSAGKCVWK